MGSFDKDEWLADCKKRVAKMKYEEQKKNLQELESRLDKLVSPERRRELELEALEKAVNELQ